MGVSHTSKIWLLERAAAPHGFSPNASGTVSLLKNLEMDGLVRPSDVNPVWFITDAGRKALAESQ